MKNLFASICIIFLMTTATHAQASDVDEFQKYPAQAKYQGEPAKPILDAKRKRKYRTTVRYAAEAAADFNGHYKLFRWGCGTNCIGWGVLNQKTGSVWMPPIEVNSCWAYNESKTDEDKKIPNYFEYSVDSSLLYAYECDDTTGKYVFNIRKVYIWKNDKPSLLRTDQVTY